MKVMLASDWDEGKVQFPVLAQPKIDGVRGLNMLGGFTGRSLKAHANTYSTDYFSRDSFLGFDGEMAAEHECHPDLCRLTSSALSTIAGQPWLQWHVFDYLTPATLGLPYAERLLVMEDRVIELSCPHLKVIPSTLCANLDQVLQMDAAWLDAGYEGTILRNPSGKHKQGRSTVKEGGLLRIKRFIDFEVVVTEISEGELNTNEAQSNELGLQFRSSHKANMVPNGMVGAMHGVAIADVKDDNGAILFAKGKEVRFGAGRMSHDDRLRFFQSPHLLLGQVAKVKTFPKGVKDKPRFPTFQSIREVSDL